MKGKQSNLLTTKRREENDTAVILSGIGSHNGSLLDLFQTKVWVEVLKSQRERHHWAHKMVHRRAKFLARHHYYNIAMRNIVVDALHKKGTYSDKEIQNYIDASCRLREDIRNRVSQGCAREVKILMSHKQALVRSIEAEVKRKTTEKARVDRCEAKVADSSLTQEGPRCGMTGTNLASRQTTRHSSIKRMTRLNSKFCCESKKPAIHAVKASEETAERETRSVFKEAASNRSKYQMNSADSQEQEVCVEDEMEMTTEQPFDVTEGSTQDHPGTDEDEESTDEDFGGNHPVVYIEDPPSPMTVKEESTDKDDSHSDSFIESAPESVADDVNLKIDNVRSLGLLERILEVQMLCLHQSTRIADALEEANRLKKNEI